MTLASLLNSFGYIPSGPRDVYIFSCCKCCLMVSCSYTSNATFPQTLLAIFGSWKARWQNLTVKIKAKTTIKALSISSFTISLVTKFHAHNQWIHIFLRLCFSASAFGETFLLLLAFTFIVDYSSRWALAFLTLTLGLWTLYHFHILCISFLCLDSVMRSLFIQSLFLPCSFDFLSTGRETAFLIWE